VIKKDEIIDAQILPNVQMPNPDEFALPPQWNMGRQGFRVTPERRYFSSTAILSAG
jgi:hypothetical protein